MVMDGHIIIFVCTKNEIFERSEIEQNLKTEFSSQKEAADNRKELTRLRLTLDYQEGVRDMIERNFIKIEDNQERLSKSLQIFCVSSMDYQKIKGIRSKKDGKPKVYRKLEETEIPQLKKVLWDESIKKRKNAIKVGYRHLRRVFKSIYSKLNEEKTENEGKRKRAIFCKDTCSESSTIDINSVLNELESNTNTHFLKLRNNLTNTLNDID